MDAVTPAFVAAANALPLTQGPTTVKHTGPFLADLGADDRRAVTEYLKTL